MICQRCLSAEARFRAAMDVMNITVCVGCMKEALKLGIAVEPRPEDSGTLLTYTQTARNPKRAATLDGKSAF